jgi:hypothetical protein
MISLPCLRKPKSLRIRPLLGLAILLCPLTTLSQTTTDDKLPATISGRVTDRARGAPIPDAHVSLHLGIKRIGGYIFVGRESEEISTKTDADGFYKFTRVPPGQCRLSVRTHDLCTPAPIRDIDVKPGQDLNVFDFPVISCGKISGSIVDSSNGEPIPGMTVFLVTPEYWSGKLRYPVRALAFSDYAGQYTLPAEPERGHIVLAVKRTLVVDGRSDAPTDTALRRSIYAPTYYPSTTLIENAQSLTLRPGEHREGVDVRVVRSRSYCVEGILRDEGIAAPLRFSVIPAQPSVGMFSEGSLVLPQPTGKSGPDGRIRVCGLSPGEYRLVLFRNAGDSAAKPSAFGTQWVTVVDRDVSGLDAAAQAGRELSGEVVLEGEATEEAGDSQTWIVLRPISRPQFPGEVLQVRSGIPGRFGFPSLLLDEYIVQVVVRSPDLYLKDVKYGGISVMNATLRLGSVIGDGKLQVVIGRGSGSISIRVVDRDGEGIPGASVFVMPRTVVSEPELAATLIRGQSDQRGHYFRGSVPPGKYAVLAALDPVSSSPESIRKLFQARSKAETLEVESSRVVQLVLRPVTLD